MTEYHVGAEPAPIESASATTSQDNSTTSPVPYIIAAVIVLFVSTISVGCTALFRDVLDDTLDEYASQMPIISDTGTDDIDVLLDELLQDYPDLPSIDNDYDFDFTPDQNADIVPETVSVADALALNLAPYSTLIDDEVSASSYSGARQEVVDYVRSVVRADKTATGELVRMLRAASRDEATLEAKLAEAIGYARSVPEQEAFAAVPELGEGVSEDIMLALGEGRSFAVDRWGAIADELEAIAAGDADIDRLQQIDDIIWDSTEDAGDEFEKALATSARM